MKPKNIKVKDDEISISFFENKEKNLNDVQLEEIKIKNNEVNVSFFKIDNKENIKKEEIDVLEDKIEESVIKNSERNEEEKRRIREKLEKYNEYLSFFSSILAIITAGGVIFYFFINNGYQETQSRIFSLPKHFFQKDIYVSIYTWVLLVPLLMYVVNRKIKEIKVSFYFYLIIMEFFLTIFNMYFWSDKLHGFFSKFTIYNNHPTRIVLSFLLILTVIFFLLNLIIFKKNISEKKRNNILGLLYIFMWGLYFFGNGSIYEVISENKKNDNKKIDVIVGYCDGVYAIASAIDKGKIISFDKDSIKLVKIEDIRRTEKKYFREEEFK